MIEPDEEQLAILASTARFNAIDGNAGAAKTTTLALKVLDALRHGMAPEDILVLTYSPAAVLAFQQRLRWIGVERETVLQTQITTFDALCHARLQVLQGDCQYLKHPNREVHETVQRAIQQARLRAERRHLGDAFVIPGEGTLLIPVLLYAFKRLKGTLAVNALGNEFVLTEASALEAGLDFTETAVLQAYELLRHRLREGQRSFRDSLAPLFDHVVMPDVDAAHFDGAAQEERNLFYVGASRARLRLTMTFRDRPSSFLDAFGRESDWDEVVGSGEIST